MKTKLLFGLAVATLLLNSCQNEKVENTVGKSATVKEEAHLCIEKTLTNQTANRGGTVTSKKWTNGQTISVLFLNGSPLLKQKVQQIASEWMVCANIKLLFNNDPNADIQINFDNSNSTWSYVGTDCHNIPNGQPTMNFGWFNDNTSTQELSRNVLHEFGHALGMFHEQGSPNQNISWNYQYVYAYYARPENGGWSRARVDWDVFYKYSLTQTNSSNYDPFSIMHYPLPASFTTNGYSVGWNNYLSTTDKIFMESQYPFPANAVRNVALFYKHDSFNSSGYAIGLPVGNFTLSQLQARGILNDDISSLKVFPGYKVTLYRDDFFQNSALDFYNDKSDFYNINGWNFNDLTSSIKIIKL
jgi:serralysin